MNDLFQPPVTRKTPRPYQTTAITNLRASLGRGNKRVVLQLPTGAGKTLTAALIVDMALTKGSRVLFTVPALSLVDQTVEAFESEGISDVGVMQGWHERTNGACAVQVASVQTLERRPRVSADLVIVDEAHIQRKWMIQWMHRCPEQVFIGLSATPWASGMGLIWQDLVIGETLSGLIDAGYLAPFRAFAPAHPDLTGIKNVAGEYHQGELGETMQETGLVSDVVATWMEKAVDRPTLCFAVDRAHAAKLAGRFEAEGIPSAYVDCHTDALERRLIEDRFREGEIRVVCNCRTLTTGVDWPVACIIDAAPTRSKMLHVQKIGRGLRVTPGWDDCLILDHSDNSLRLGLVTDIRQETLSKGQKAEKAKAENKDPLPKECPKCTYLKAPKVRECPKCGFTPEVISDIEEAEGELVEIGRGSTKKQTFTRDEKQRWYSELLSVAQDRNRSAGWVAHTFREKIGVWPRGLNDEQKKPSRDVLGFVRHKDIRYAKSRKKETADAA